MSNDVKTRILFNCTTNIVGGGLKNSSIFIKNALNCKEFDWVFAISRPVKDLLEKWNISTENMHLFETSPARSSQGRRRLLNLSEEFNVDCIYTMAGPAYIRFKRKHIMGISNPYYTHADFQGFRVGRNFIQIVKLLLLFLYVAFYIRRADFFIFQTNQSMQGFCRRFLIRKDKTAVIPNAIGNEFKEHFKAVNRSFIDTSKTINIFCPAAAYPHKVIHLIPKIASDLINVEGSNYKFKFIITIDKESKYYKQILRNVRKLKIEESIENIGKYSYSDSIKLHEMADVIFVPSIVETFSASYLEAFAAKKTLIVADKNFAHDICKNGAVYVNPFNSNQTAQRISNLISNESLQADLVSEGNKILNQYRDQENRYKTIIKYLKKIK